MQFTAPLTQIFPSPDRNHDVILQTVHDIRSPLSTLKILMDRLDRAPHSVQRELVTAVVQRIEEIAEDLLDQCRTNSCLKTLTLEDSIRAVVNEKILEHGPEVRFESHLDSRVAKLIIAPREWMRLISNLINNAVEAGARIVRIEVADRGDRVELSVHDEGRGLPPEILALIQNGATLSFAKKGCGLGLRHAKRFAQSVSGELRIDSVPGKGTNVCLSLPRENFAG